MKRNLIFIISSILLIGILITGRFLIYPNFKSEKQENFKTTESYILDAFTHKYARAKEDFKIQVLTETGNFAKGSVNYNNEHGGGLWFAVRHSGGWELVYEGNGIMPCNIANKYDLPVEMVPGCVETENGNAFVQR